MTLRIWGVLCVFACVMISQVVSQEDEAARGYGECPMWRKSCHGPFPFPFPFPPKGTCKRFDKDFCKRVRCDPRPTEQVCCGGKTYNNCCMAVCVSNVSAKSCRPGKCKEVDKCYICSLTPGAYMPRCCRGKKQYNNPCEVKYCGKENPRDCREGRCGESPFDLLQPAPEI